MPNKSQLSKRSQPTLLPLAEYKKAHFGSRSQRYSPANPDGVISFCIAENKLSADLVVNRINRVSVLPEDQMFYGAGCRATVAKFVSTYITHHPIHVDDVVPAGGVSGALDLLLFALCDVNDSVLIVAPGYNGFSVICSTRNSVRTVIAQLDGTNNFRLDVSALESAWQKEGGPNSSIRCVIITSPMNPTGEVLSTETIQQIVSWARARNIHSVFDEIYALSCFSPHSEFVSVAQALDNNLSDDVHLLWALSKDYCASGLRMGAVISQNKELIRRLWPAATLSGVSRHTQFAIGELLNDDEFTVQYLTENRRRLHHQYTVITELLKEDVVDFVPAEAGTFVFIDFRRFLNGAPSKESELELFNRLFNKAKVILSPSSDMFGTSYGWFRLCFASVKEDVLREGWRRIREELRWGVNAGRRNV